MIVFLTLITIPLLTEQFAGRASVIYPKDYLSLITAGVPPSLNIAYIYELGNFILPILLIASWILTVSLLKTYVSRVGKTKFWLLVSVPLLLQLFSYIIRNVNLAGFPSLVDIVYGRDFQFFLGISYQLSGLFFAVAFLTAARNIKRKLMKNYFIMCSIGIAGLLSSLQPGMPFYAAYPPFGLVTISFLGMSSFLLLIGMLGSAAYVSRDTELRKEVFKDLGDVSRMLRSMGFAEMQLEMERKITPLIDRINLSEDMRDHIDTSQEDVKLVIKEVLDELHKKHSRPKENSL